MKKKDHSKRFKEFLEELAAGKEDIELIKIIKRFIKSGLSKLVAEFVRTKIERSGVA